MTKRQRGVAKPRSPKRANPVNFPNFLARLKKIFGNKRLKISGAEQLAAEREPF
jgi:tRNA (Thr-GGU) A37 N-methylase